MRNASLICQVRPGARLPALWLLPLGLAAAMAQAQEPPAAAQPPVAAQAVEAETAATAPAVAVTEAPAAAPDASVVAAGLPQETAPASIEAVTPPAVVEAAPVPQPASAAAIVAAPAEPVAPVAPAPAPPLVPEPAPAPMTAAAAPSAAPEPVSQPAAQAPAPMPAAEPVPAPTPVAVAPDAVPASAAPAPASAPAPPAALPIIPLAPDQAVERQLGARCPVDLAGRLAPQGDLMIGACQGTLPSHLAALLVALPEQDIHLPRSWREREVRQKTWFKAVAGVGQRPDFIARLGDIWVRSFEGADASVTTYLVSAPFDCADGALPSEGSPEPVRVAAGSCGQAYLRQRVYQQGSDGVPVDVTAKVMPTAPVIAESDRARHRSREGKVSLDHSKLQYGPAMRWFVQYPESPQKTGPHSFSDWNREHLAFVVWNGRSFDLRDTVTRQQWPCDPVAPGDKACGGFPDSGPDTYVRAETATASAVSSP